MQKSSSRLIRCGMFAFAAAVGALITTAAPAAGAVGCGHGVCPALYAPVKCSNGVTYSNGCYAARACQTNCVPVGGPFSPL